MLCAHDLGSKHAPHGRSGLVIQHTVCQHTACVHHTLQTQPTKQVRLFRTGNIAPENAQGSTAVVAQQTVMRAVQVTRAPQQCNGMGSLLCQVGTR